MNGPTKTEGFESLELCPQREFRLRLCHDIGDSLKEATRTTQARGLSQGSEGCIWKVHLDGPVKPCA